MNVIWAQKWKGRARETREGKGRVSPLRSVFFLAPIFHAVQSNNLVTVDHFKVYAFPVLKAIKYSCNLNFTFSALKVANSQFHFQSLNCNICKRSSRWFHLRAQFGNQHISLRPNGEGLRGGNENKFMRDRCKLTHFSPPLALASPFACCSRVTSRDSLK